MTRMLTGIHAMKILAFLMLVFSSAAYAQYSVEVQVVDLAVAVYDKEGNYRTDVNAEDFIVYEDGKRKEVVGIDTERHPFSIGILIDTSGSMQPNFRATTQIAKDFIYSLQPEDEFFLMHFDHRIVMKQDFIPAAERSKTDLDGLRYFSPKTRLFDGIMKGIDEVSNAKYPNRALLVISDGVNTSGAESLKSTLDRALKTKTLIYSLIIEIHDYDFNPLRILSETTGASHFLMNYKFPRAQAAYEKIAKDLAHRMTLNYRSEFDFSTGKTPEIRVQMKNPELKVRYQKTFATENH